MYYNETINVDEIEIEEVETILNNEEEVEDTKEYNFDVTESLDDKNNVFVFDDFLRICRR